MRLSLLGVLAALLLVLFLGIDTAVAKGSAYLLTGGKLGSHAYLLESFIPDADGTDWVASVEGVQVDPPLNVPSLAYDIYSRFGVFAVPYQVNVRGPVMRYYPGLGLVQDVWRQRWYKPPVEAISYFDSAIQDALALLARGELEDDPFAADLRGRRMHEVSYSLLPYSPGSVALRGPGGPGAKRAECDACLGLISNVEAFVLEHLVETVSRMRTPDSAVEPAYTIEFHGWFDGGGIDGFLGFYSPPADGRAGRFWTDSAYDQETPYYETTAGFDAAIEAALAGSDTGPAPALATANDDDKSATLVGAALLAAVLGVGVVGGFARRRG